MNHGVYKKVLGLLLAPPDVIYVNNAVVMLVMQTMVPWFNGLNIKWFNVLQG